MGVNGQYRLLNWRIFQQPSSKAVAITTCCFYCTLFHNPLLVLGYIKSRFHRICALSSVKIYILQSLSFGGRTIYRPRAYHKENHKHNRECILDRFCVLLLSAVFVQKIFLYDKYLASYTPDALRRYLSYPILSKIGVGRTFWLKLPNINLNLKKIRLAVLTYWQHGDVGFLGRTTALLKFLV